MSATFDASKQNKKNSWLIYSLFNQVKVPKQMKQNRKSNGHNLDQTELCKNSTIFFFSDLSNIFKDVRQKIFWLICSLIDVLEAYNKLDWNGEANSNKI